MKSIAKQVKKKEVVDGERSPVFTNVVQVPIDLPVQTQREPDGTWCAITSFGGAGYGDNEVDAIQGAVIRANFQISKTKYQFSS